MSIHREGYKYILIATLIFGLELYCAFHFLAAYAWIGCPLSIIFFLLWFWVIWFFRLPARNFTVGNNLIVAPADGKVVVIEETFEAEYYKDRRLQVSIFMSPLNVHINRSPIAGVVRLMKYHAGKYLVAYHPKSSTENERTTLVVENEKISILLRQIAGALARRICYYVKEGDSLQQNGEFGFIRFGSRVDIYLPIGTEVTVKLGDKVQGGISVVAKY